MTTSQSFEPVASGVDRRQLLRFGGFAALGGVALAACGTDDTAGTVTVPPRLGDAPPPSTLPPADIDDVVILRTATSLEYSAISTYDLVLNNFAGLFTGPAAALIPVVERLRADHVRHAEAVANLTVDAGGEVYACPNERIASQYLEPAVELIVGSETAATLGIPISTEPIAPSDTPLLDLVVLAQGLESLAASTYQGVVPTLSRPALRQAAMTIAADEARHATLLVSAVLPDQILPNESNPVAMVPSTFGQLGQIPVPLGVPNSVGNKAVVNLQTPSLNALIYSYLGAC